MAHGIIKTFNPDTGNGYIVPDGGGDEVPFDRDALDDYHQGDVVQTGEAVTYEVEGGPAGTMATNVRRVAPRGYE